MLPKIVVHIFKHLKSWSISSHGYSTLLIHDHNKLLLLPRDPYSFLRGVTASSPPPIVRRSARRLPDAKRRAAPLDFSFDAAVVILVLASAQERSFLSRRQWRKLTVCTWTAASWRSAADGNRTAREALLACSANRESPPTFADSSPNGSPYRIQVSTDYTFTRFQPYWIFMKILNNHLSRYHFSCSFQYIAFRRVFLKILWSKLKFVVKCCAVFIKTSKCVPGYSLLMNRNLNRIITSHIYCITRYWFTCGYNSTFDVQTKWLRRKVIQDGWNQYSQLLHNTKKHLICSLSTSHIGLIQR